MSNDEFKLIQLTFQLHCLIAEGKCDSDEADVIRGKMEFFDRELITEDFNTIHCYCYALAETDPDLKKRYRELLFADTIDHGELTKIFAKSDPNRS